MKSETKFMLPYLDGTDKKFHIPVYQRAYSWKQKDCEQLLEDVLSVMEKNREKHFFGSIVFCPCAGGLAAQILAIKHQHVKQKLQQARAQMKKKYIADSEQGVQW